MENLKDILLNGMETDTFILYYVIALVGVFLFFMGRVYGAINLDPKTSFTWNWRHFWAGTIKVMATMLLLPLVIIYFSDFGPWMFDLSEGSTIDLNAKSAFLTGIGIDGMIIRIFKLINSGKAIAILKKKS